MIRYSRGRGIHDNRPRQLAAETFAEFVEAIERHRAPRKEAAGYFAGPLNGDGKRRAEGVLPRRFIVLDLDRIAADVLPDLRMHFAGRSGAAWPTHSSKPEAPRERVILELDREATRAECLRLGAVVMRDLGEAFGDAVELDASTFRGEQPIFDPPTRATIARFFGDPIPVDAWLATAPEVEAAPPHREAGDAAGKVRTKRNEFLSREAFRLRKLGLEPAALADVLLALNRAHCAPPVDDDEVRGIAERKRIVAPDPAEAEDVNPLAERVAHLPEQWAEERPPPRPFVIHPYIPRRATSAVIGAGTASKSLLLCEWAAAIAAGVDWRGHPVAAGEVAILTWEDELADYHAKLYSLIEQRPDLKALAAAIRARVHFVEFHGTPLRLVAPDERGRAYITPLAEHFIDLAQRSGWRELRQVFIETVSRANSAGEDNEGFSQVIAAGEAIARALDVGVTYAHHISKSAAAGSIIDATAGRGGSALADNARATTVVALIDGDDPQSLWPAGFTKADFDGGPEIVLIENARSSYGRRAERLHLARRYPAHGAPYLAEIEPATTTAGPKCDRDAERLFEWLATTAQPELAERGVVDRRGEYGLTERAARAALARLVAARRVDQRIGKQYGDRGRDVAFYRPRGGQDALL